MDKNNNTKLKGIFQVTLSFMLFALIAAVLLACVPHEQNFLPSDPSSGEEEISSVTTTASVTQAGEPEPTSGNPVIGKPAPPNSLSRHTTYTTTTTLSETTTTMTTTTSTRAKNIGAAPVGKVGAQAVAIRVFQDRQTIVIYGKDEAGQEIPIDALYCSTGYSTPTTSHTKPILMTGWKSSFLRFSLVGNSYVRHTTHIYGDYFFHSVPYEHRAGSKTFKYDECWVNTMGALGNYRSTSGCIRLAVRDARKLQTYVNKANMPLYILNDSSGYSWPTPQGIPAIKEGPPYKSASTLGWDPTDWHQDNPYLQLTPPTTTTEPTTTTTEESTTAETTSTTKPAATTKPTSADKSTPATTTPSTTTTSPTTTTTTTTTTTSTTTTTTTTTSTD